jgi:hypothetical protein
VDLNQLYFDHQISLMQENAAASDGLRRLLRDQGAAIASRIADVLRASGAAALRGWEARP